MDATIHDLRYRMSSVLEALDRREEVRVLCKGKPKWRILPEGGVGTPLVRDHAFFGSRSDVKTPVSKVMSKFRSGR